MHHKKIFIGFISFIFIFLSAFGLDKQTNSNVCAPEDELCLLKNYIEENSLRQSPELVAVYNQSANNPFLSSIEMLPKEIIFKLNAPAPPPGFENYYHCGDRICKLREK